MSKIRDLMKKIFDSDLVKKIEKILDILFPVVILLKANRKIDTKINHIEQGKLDLEYMYGYQVLTVKDAEGYLTKTFDARKTIEDKAKINVLGVTISVTLIMGLSQALNNSFPMLNSLKIFTIILGIYALLSVILATVLSLFILGKYNRVYDLTPSDKSTNNVQTIALNVELNSLYNVKRNNYLYSSYMFMINFLVSLSILFILLTIPSVNAKSSLQVIQDKQAKIQVEVDKIKEAQQIQGQIIQSLEENNLIAENMSQGLKKLQHSQSEIITRINSLQEQLK